MTPLWPHQQAAADLLAPLGYGCLFMDMGTGKTRTALELVTRWQCRRVLILCPKSVVRVWPGEFRKHLSDVPWQCLPLDSGSTADRHRQLHAAALCAECDDLPFAAALNYEALVNWPETMPEFDCLILDECHRLKAPDGRQSQLAAQLAARIPHRLGLTGTPMPHSQLDVFGQLRAVAPAVLGDNWWAFRSRYAVVENKEVPIAKPGARGKDRWQRDPKTKKVLTRKINQVTGYQHTEELQAKLATVSYRVASDDVLQLPDAVDELRYCLLSDRARSSYEALLTDFAAEVDGGLITAANALSRLIRLLQVCNGYGVDTEGNHLRLDTAKADLLEEVLEELPAGEPVVVFGRFLHDLDDVRDVAKRLKRGYRELSGRRNELADWQAASGNEVLAVQLQAGGTGVDFTRARYQIYFSHDHNLGNYLQTRKRIHRPGQTRSVTYLHLLAAGTVDETVLSALETRNDVVSAVVDGITTLDKSHSST